MTDDLLLAVDAGGTKTAAWLVDPSRSGTKSVLGAGRSTAGNPLSVGIAEATRAITEAVSRAQSAARRKHERIPRAILSIAGAANPTLRRQFLEWARDIRLADEVAIVADVWPVLAAGTPRCSGVALISGTGSVAFARNDEGRTARCGGWGYLLGDEGSGFAIGRSGLQHALMNLEAQAELTPLAEAVLDTVGADSVLAVTRTIYRRADQRSAIAAVASVVIEAADEGDEDAAAIILAAADGLAKLVGRTAKVIGMHEETFPLALAGGIMTASDLLVDRLEQQLEGAGLTCEIKLVDEPLEGCVRLATSDVCTSLVTWC